MDRRSLLIAGSSGVALPLLLQRVAFAQGTASDYKTDTLTVGTLSKKMSQMAQDKAKNAHVLEFAGFEVAEQTAIARVLTDQADPPPAPLPAADKEMLAKLDKESGVEFEKAYIRGQIDGHQKLLAIQEAQLKKGRTSDVGHVAELAKTVIDMHLKMLHDLEKMVG